jgi:hypothetical protein
MIEVESFRSLTLKEPSQPGRPSFISAASGLVYILGDFYVIADDEVALARFSDDPKAAGILYALLDFELPIESAERKKLKPDWESLVILSNRLGISTQTLLAIPSGSTENRHFGSLIELNEMGRVASANAVDFQPLYSELRLVFKELNVEGAIVGESTVKLFQRGNKNGIRNGWVELNRNEACKELRISRQLTSKSIESFQIFDLGMKNKVPYSFTDVSTFYNHQILFVAAAEDTENAYVDGAFLGSVIGTINECGQVTRCEELNIPYKPEGICWTPELGPKSFILVTDSDDPNVPSQMYRGHL